MRLLVGSRLIECVECITDHIETIEKGVFFLQAYIGMTELLDRS